MKSMANILIAVIIVTAIGVVLLMPSGGASPSGFVLLTQNKDEIDSYFENGKLNNEMIDEINSNISNVPEQLFELFGNSKINIYVEFDDGSEEDYWVHTTKNKVEQFFQGARSNADVEIHLKESTIDKIVASDDAFTEFIDAMNSGEIKYSGLTLGGTVKSAAVSVTTTVIGIVNGTLGFFSGLFG